MDAGTPNFSSVFSLELAIYFILPAAIFGACVYVGAVVLVSLAELSIQREVSHETAMSSIACVIGSTGLGVGLAYSFTQFPAILIAFSFTVYFLTGCIFYSRISRQPSRCRYNMPANEVGLVNGARVSAILTCMLSLAALLLFLVVRGHS